MQTTNSSTVHNVTTVAIPASSTVRIVANAVGNDTTTPGSSSSQYAVVAQFTRNGAGAPAQDGTTQAGTAINGGALVSFPISGNNVLVSITGLNNDTTNWTLTTYTETAT